MNVTVLNKSEFNSLMTELGIDDNTVINQTKSFFISINYTDNVDTHFQRNHPNVLIVRFDDIIGSEPVMNEYGKLMYPFTDDIAEEIADFIHNNTHKKQCIVHCNAGISRSGAIGSFINDITFGNYLEFKQNNKRIQPNSFVYSKLKEVYLNKYNN